MKAYQDYTHFQAEDFLADPPFREWVDRPTPEMNAYWQGLLQTHTHLDEAFNQARLVALGLESSWTTFSDKYVDNLYNRIQQRASETDEGVNWRNWRTYRMAAAVSAILLIGVWAGRYFFMEQTIRTGYGELKEVTLFDGSQVTLNANSSLRLPSRLNWQTTREVWLNGEAYFSVQKQPDTDGHSYRKFTVHTHRVNVTVLGTRFNIYTRPQKTQVMLDEGRVELARNSHERPILMRPGELVEYGVTRHHSKIQLVKAAQVRQVVSWKKNLLSFNEAGMDELARRFSETYGLALVLEGDAFSDQQFTGELPINDLNKALLILSKTFDMQAVKDEQRVYFITNQE